MAARRMFSKALVESDDYLEMPISAQALYFHICMRADDDGFINNLKSIMRQVGCREDDVKVLVAKKYIITFENGICVISHWNLHNKIQKDRYHETEYLEYKKMLTIEKNNTYNINLNMCTQNVSKLDTQVSLEKKSIEKVSGGELRKGEKRLGPGREREENPCYVDETFLINNRKNAIRDELSGIGELS